MSKPVLLSLGAGKVQELAGTSNNDVLTWNSATSEWVSAAGGGGGGSGTVTSVGLTGGTSGMVIGGTASPITTSGTYNLDAPLRFAFNTATPTEVAAAGQVSYNTDEGSLEQMFDGGHVKSVLGQTLHQRVLNETGSALTKGQVVYVSGAQGNRVTVDLALADADSTSATILGLVAYAIADGAEGYVITEGLIKGVVTTGFTEGAPVYLSPTTPGALTQTKPVAPEHLVLVGYCVRADATVGEILIKTQNGYEIEELHDVYVNNPQSGQLLIYDATSGQTRWENVSMSGDATLAATGAITLKNTGSAGTYGSSSAVPVFQTDAQGRVTSVTNTNIDFAGNAITSITGTANQVTVTGTVGSVTLSLPSTLNPTAASTATAFTLQGGAGSGSGSAGGKLFLYGGAAGSGNANGGAVEIDGGAKAGTGTKGDVLIGRGTTTNVVQLGGQNVTTNVYGSWVLADATYSVLLANTSDVVPLCPVIGNTVIVKARGIPGTGTSAGKALTLSGGDSTATNGNGGALSLLGGTLSGTGVNGVVNVGTSSTSAVNIGASGITTTINGTTSLVNALAIASGGTNNASLSVAQGTVYYGDGSKLVGLAPGTSGHFLKTNGAGANPEWAAAGGGGSTPYDLSGEFVGTPVASAVIMRFVAARAFTFGGTAYFVCTSNTGATTAVFTVNVNSVSKGTVSIAGNATSGTGTITSTSVSAGDLIEVVATTPANVVNPYWTLPGTV